MPREPNIALVHESLNTLGGAERVLQELVAIFPDAPVFTLETGRPMPFVAAKTITPSFLQALPRLIRASRLHLPLFPIAAETFDFSAYDIVISSASGFAKGVVTRPGTLHICYCHAPTRFLWDAYHDVRAEFPQGSLRRGMFQALMHGLRIWDRAAVRRVDLFLANSETTRKRIEKYYHRESTVIYPPVSIAPHASLTERTYFLFVGRLSPYKGAALAVETFRKLELPLVVVGEGRESAALRRMRSPSITFRGCVPDAELSQLYAGARAVIFPSDDDFGIVPVEAMAQGTPVLALRRGGATETVLEGVTGEFFDEPSEEFLADCVRRFLEREHSYDRAAIRAQAEKFSAERFRSAIRSTVADAWESWQRREVRSVAHASILR